MKHKIIFEVSKELKLELVKECFFTNVKIRQFITGLIKAYLKTSLEDRKWIVKIILEEGERG